MCGTQALDLAAARAMDVIQGSPVKQMGPNCQYFVMSPRQSLESPRRPLACAGEDDPQDENAAPTNVHSFGKKGLVQIPKTGKTLGGAARSAGQPSQNSSHGSLSRPLSARSTGTGREPPPVQVLPCMRPASPAKKKGLEQSSPAPRGQMHGTPSVSHMEDSPGQEASIIDDGASFASMSVGNASVGTFADMSTFSCSSRLDSLSRRSVSHRQLSTDELKRREVLQKKADLARQMRKNEENCRKNRDPDTNFITGHKSTKITVPKEFALSQPGTPRLKESRESRGFPDNEDSVCSVQSARGPRRQAGTPATPATPQTPLSSQRSTTPTTKERARADSAKRWRPQLTVPKGPTCASPELLSSRRSLSAPPQREDLGNEPSVSESTSSQAPYVRQPTPQRRDRTRGTPVQPAAAVPVRQPTPERRAQPTRTSTPERRVQAAQPARTSTPERRVQPTRTATPERTRTATPERRVQPSTSASTDEKQARARRARELALQKSQEQAAKKQDRFCVFRKPASTPGTEAPASARAAPVAAGRTSPRLSVGSVGTGSELGSVGTGKVLQRRPSFGSTSKRPCC